MAHSVKPVSSPASPLTSPLSPPSLELPSLSSVHQYLEEKNHQFVSTLAPTLSCLALLVLCGLVGNTLVFVVYYRRFKPSVTRTYILAMSVCDLLTNVLSLPADIVEVRFHNNFTDPWLCKAFRTVKSFLGFLSAFILVAVAFDRQRAICNPHSNPPTVKHTVIVLVIVSASSLGFTVPYSVMIGSRTMRFPDSNVTGVECTVDDVYFQSLFLFVYNVLTGLVLVTCISLMLGSYIRIARQLWLHKKNTAAIIGTAADRQDRRKASTLSSHTYTFEESSSHNTQSSSHTAQSSSHTTQSSSHTAQSSSDTTQSSSDRSQQSLKVRSDQTKPAMTLAQIGNAPIQEEPPEGSCAETALHGADNPHGACPSTGTHPGDGPCPQTPNSDSKPRPQTRTPNSDSKPRPQTQTPSPDSKPEAGSASGQDTVASITAPSTGSEATLHSCTGRKPSDPKHRGHASSSRSALSRIGRTASNAKSFVTRKKSTSTARGSVKKIPTRTTFMMFVLTVIFILNYLPYLLLVSIRSRVGNDVMERSLGMNGYHLGLRSYFLNSAINPLVYSFCSARFRQECRRLFHCKRC